eukprot:3528650-Rhodomonas_salina.1
MRGKKNGGLEALVRVKHSLARDVVFLASDLRQERNPMGMFCLSFKDVHETPSFPPACECAMRYVRTR